MSAPNPDHLLDIADQLAAVTIGQPRQANLRRSISTSYYGLFHATLAAAADVLPRARQNPLLYSLVYRSIDHKGVRDLCAEARRTQLSDRIKAYFPGGAFCAYIQVYATTFLELYEKRHLADYDPSYRISAIDARLAVTSVSAAVHSLSRASGINRDTFLILLLFPKHR